MREDDRERFGCQSGANSRSVLVAFIGLGVLGGCLAYAVSTPLIGGGVAEWLKAAVC